MASAAAWAGLAGLANFIGGRMQDSYEDERRQKLAAMQEEAQMKRQMFLEEYRNKIQQQSREADHERTKGDVTASFTNPETGSVYGRTRGGDTVPLMETSQQYRDDLAAQRRANNDFKDQQVEFYRRRSLDAENRIKHRDNPLPRATPRGGASGPKEQKPDKPSSLRLNNNQWMKYHEADDTGPSYPANPYAERPSLDNMPDQSGGTQPVFVDPSERPAHKREDASTRSANTGPTPEQILADANVKAQQIAKIADPEQRQAAQAKLDAAVKAMFHKYGYTQS